MKRISVLLLALICIAMVMCISSCSKSKTPDDVNKTEKTGSECSHTYSPATCTSPKTCSKCGNTEGSKLPHSWSSPSCGEYPKCTQCGIKAEHVVEHDWREATCTEPKTCEKCGATSGEPLGHDYDLSNPTVIKESSCTEEGESVYYCRRCSDSITKTIQPQGHISSENGRCAVCGLNMFVGSKMLDVRTDEMLVDLSGREHLSCDIINLNEYYDIEYLRSQGYTKIIINGQLDIKKTLHVLSTWGGEQQVYLYPTEKCSSGWLEDAVLGTYVEPVLAKFIFNHHSYSYKTYSFEASLNLVDLTEGCIYIRYDVGNTDIWTNRNLKVTITPSK